MNNIPIQYVDATALVLAVAWGLLLPVVARRVARPAGVRLARALLLLGYLALPPCVYAAPPCLVRAAYGSFPLGDREDGIEPGMTAAEVRAALGPPHEVLGPTDAPGWIYWRDSWGRDCVGVRFDAGGRVAWWWVS